MIYDRGGQRIAELYGAVNRIVVPSNHIPAVMKNATVAIEDKRFYQHHGVDFTGIARALVDDIKAGHVVAGREHDHRAVRQERLHRRRPHLHPQAARGGAGPGARRPLVQRQDPHRVPEHRLLRRRRLRVQAASLTYFHKPVVEGDAAPGGAARRPARVPQRVLADHRPRA